MDGTLRLLKGIALAACLLCATACQMATPYHRSVGSDRFGYAEYRIDDHTYTVFFNGNENTPAAKVWYYWVYRCAELTQEQGYDLFAMVPAPPHVKVPRPSPSLYKLQPASVDTFPDAGQADEAPGHLIAVSGEKSDPFAYSYKGYVILKDWTDHGTMSMYHAPLPQSVQAALDARVITAALKAYVESGGHGKVPSQTDLLMQAVVVHKNASI